ncbi:50S ribosome-binding GTPase, partial [bacterium]|nr:50S ribosome-binding GTPase [bacterium]
MEKVSWYPGHIKTAKQKIKKVLSVIDIIFEVVDARLPVSSNILFDNESSLFKNKKRFLLLNKSDLVNINELKYWQDYFRSTGEYVDVITTCSSGRGTAKTRKEILKLLEHYKKEKNDKSRYRKNSSLRVMIAGFPNVGKSSALNILSPAKHVRVGNKPGVTRGTQWIKLKDGIELLDTPGVIFPDKIGRGRGMKLLFCKLIPMKAEKCDPEMLLAECLPYLLNKYKWVSTQLKEKCGFDPSEKNFFFQ